MYVVWTTTAFTTSAPAGTIAGATSNQNYNQLMDNSTATTPVSFTYDGNSIANTTNSVMRMTTTPVTTAYVWINVNPTTSPTAPFDVITTFDNNGNIVAFDDPFDDPNINIIQNSGKRSNGTNLYYVYASRPLNIINNTTSVLQALAPSTSSNTVQLNQQPYPPPGDGRNPIFRILPGSGTFRAFIADPFLPNNNIFIWRGSPQTGNLADYAANLRIYDFLLQDSAPTPPVTMIVTLSDNTMTLSDIVCSTNRDCPTGQTCSNGRCVISGDVGTSCTTSSDCEQGLSCINATCQVPPSNGGGFPWWGWLLIGLTIVIIIVIFIIIVYHSRSKPKVETPPPATPTATPATTTQPLVVTIH